MSLILLQNPNTGQRVYADDATADYQGYLAGGFVPASQTQTTSTPTPVSTPASTMTQPTENPWYGIPSDISSQFNTTEQAQQYWAQQDPNQISGADVEGYVTQLLTTHLGRQPTQTEIDRLRGNWGTFRDSSGINTGAIQAEIQQQFPSTVSGTIAGAVGAIPNFDELVKEFMTTDEGKRFQEFFNQTRVDLTKSYDIEQERLNIQRRALEQDYQNMLDDIQEGRMHAGGDYQRQQQYDLEQRNLFLEESEAKLNQTRDELNRSFISRGGLFSGPRQEAIGLAESAEERARRAFETGYTYKTGQQEADYQKQLSDYLKQEREGRLAHERALPEFKEGGYQQQALDISRKEALRGLTAEEEEAKRARVLTNLSPQYGY